MSLLLPTPGRQLALAVEPAGRYAWAVDTGRVSDLWTGLDCSRTWAPGAGLPRVRVGERRILLGALIGGLLPPRWAGHVVTLAPEDSATLKAEESIGGPNSADIPLSLLILRAPGRPGRGLGQVRLESVYDAIERYSAERSLSLPGRGT